MARVIVTQFEEGGHTLNRLYYPVIKQTPIANVLTPETNRDFHAQYPNREIIEVILVHRPKKG